MCATKASEGPHCFPKSRSQRGDVELPAPPAFWLGSQYATIKVIPRSKGTPDANVPCPAASDPQHHLTDPNPSLARLHRKSRQQPRHTWRCSFSPPGWLFALFGEGTATQWTAALNIDSFQSNDNTGQNNNAACAAITNNEYVNLRLSRPMACRSRPVRQPPGPPVSTNANTLLMNPGDELIVTLADTEHGLKVTVQDVTSGQTVLHGGRVGANGFASVKWDPNGNNCDFARHNLAHDFHPAYATSSEHTRVPGAAHSYNIAFSDEIGHFEYCSSVAQEFGACTSLTGKDKKPGLDDLECVDPGFLASFGLIAIGGCFDGDADFDGVPYRKNTWPGCSRIQSRMRSSIPSRWCSPVPCSPTVRVTWRISVGSPSNPTCHASSLAPPRRASGIS